MTRPNSPWCGTRWRRTGRSAPTCPRPCRSGRSGCRAGRTRGWRWGCVPGAAGRTWRSGAGTASTATRALPLPHLAGRALRIEHLHPAASPAETTWAPDRAELTVTLPHTPAALLLRLTTVEEDGRLNQRQSQRS